MNGWDIIWNIVSIWKYWVSVEIVVGVVDIVVIIFVVGIIIRYMLGLCVVVGMEVYFGLVELDEGSLKVGKRVFY